MKLKLILGATIAVVAALNVGCTSVELSPSDALGKTAKQLKIDPVSIVLQTPARFGEASPGDRYVSFKFGLFTQTKTEVDLFEYNANAGTFTNIQSIPLNSIKSVDVATWGLFGHIHQVQLVIGEKIVILNCENNSDAEGGYIESTLPVVQKLVEAGIPRGEAASRVLPIELKNFSMPIPIIKR